MFWRRRRDAGSSHHQSRQDAMLNLRGGHTLIMRLGRRMAMCELARLPWSTPQTEGPDMQIENRPIETLRAYARNARTHSKQQIRQIAKSIQRFGFCNPVLIDEHGQIVAGHGRVAAARLLGMAQ